MKRILALALVFVFAVSLVSCGAKSADELYSATVDGITYTLKSRNKVPQYVVLSQGGTVVFSESVQVDRTVGNEDGTYGFTVADLNCDGVNDFMLTDSVDGECHRKIVWIWNPSTGHYARSEELTGLYNLQFDKSSETVLSYSHEYVAEKGYADVPACHTETDKVTQWEWDGSRFKPLKYAAIIYYSETHMYCSSVAYYNSESKSFDDSDDKWYTEEQFKKEDFSYFYYFR